MKNNLDWLPGHIIVYIDYGKCVDESCTSVIYSCIISVCFTIRSPLEIDQSVHFVRVSESFGSSDFFSGL